MRADLADRLAKGEYAAASRVAAMENPATLAGEPLDELMTPPAASGDHDDERADGEVAPSATGAEAAPSEPPARARRGRPASLRRGATGADADAPGAEAPAGTPAEQQPRRPRRPGTIAAQTHAAVEDLVPVEGLTKAQAFERLGAESGRQPGTVAAAYYRAARNASAAADGARGPGRRVGARSRQSAGGGMHAFETARDALQELVELVRRQEQQLAHLRAESERYGELRAIIDGTSTPRRRNARA
jgi:hypothetical protein